MGLKVGGLFVYPVKSCRGLSFDRYPVEARGLRHDRRWMVVDPDGQFVTQRTHPRLALVQVSIDERWLVLGAKDTPPLALPIEPPPGAPWRKVRVWRDDVDALDCGQAAADWMSHWLCERVALVYMPEGVRRAVNPLHARADDVVGFADGYPLLVVTRASLDDLAERIGNDIPMNRFRPNIVIEGAERWAEDRWKRIRIADIPIRLPKPCARCVVTTTDQDTAERGIEPLKTLATFRRDGANVLFGQNAIPDAAGTLSIGQAVVVDECY